MTTQQSCQAYPQPSPANLHLWRITAVQDLFWIGLAVSTVWFGYYLRSIFIPVLIGLVLVYVVTLLVYIVAQFIEEWILTSRVQSDSTNHSNAVAPTPRTVKTTIHGLFRPL